MGKLYNLARMTTATTGTGTITLGSAVTGYLTFANAGVANADVVSYGIKDGVNSEVGTGTYTTSGTTLTRTVRKSTNGNAAISLSGSAEVYVTIGAEDINDLVVNSVTVNNTGQAIDLSDQGYINWGSADAYVQGNSASKKVVLGTNVTDVLTVLNGVAIGVGQSDPGAGNLNVAIGYRIGNAAASGNVLKGDGTNFISATPDWILLNTLTPSNVASVSDTTSFTSAYDNYTIVFENVVPASNLADLRFQVHSGGAFQSTSYINLVAGTTDINMTATNGITNTAGTGISVILNIMNINSTTEFKIVSYKGGFYSSSSSLLHSSGCGVWNGGKGAIDGFQVLFTAGNISTGTIKIYGMK